MCFNYHKMFAMKLSAVIIFTFLFCEINSANILMLNPQNAYSHYYGANKLLEKLASNGHNVTMISPYKQNKKIDNYRNIQLTEGSNVKGASLNIAKLNFFHLGEIPVWEQSLLMYKSIPLISEQALAHPAVQNLLNDPTEQFDLIILSLFNSEALYGLAHKYDVPVIIYNPTMSGVWCNHLVGNPAPSSYIPDFYSNFPGRMTFTERLYNTLFNFGQEIYRKFVYFPKIENIMHKYFPDAPPLYDLMYNRTAMVFLNTHPLISNPVPLVPAMVPVGGLHIEEPKPLPNDLQQLMDNATHGVILFSLGSNIKSVDLSSEIKQHLMNAFSKLQEIVIWKFEDENLPGKPHNVKIMKWCPQNDIMGHPNLKLFITQGGILSTTEAVYHGIPVIGIPIFADQKLNMATTTEKGYGITIPFKQLNEETLFNAIKDVILNPVYKNNVDRASKILRNQPMKPLDSAAFWVDHVLEHHGAKHFRIDAMNLTWYQLYFIDIMCALIFVISVLLYIFSYIKFYIKKILIKTMTYKEKIN